jgi:hypothetical protein
MKKLWIYLFLLAFACEEKKKEIKDREIEKDRDREIESREIERDRDVALKDLMPTDSDQWSREGELEEFKTKDELFGKINGAGEIYVKHGFVSAVLQKFKTKEGEILIEVWIYDQGTVENAKALYEDPSLSEGGTKLSPTVGKESRFKEGLASYTIEFYKNRFFSYVQSLESKEETAKEMVLSLCQVIADKIP